MDNFDSDLEPVIQDNDLEPLTPTGLPLLSKPPQMPGTGAPSLSAGLVDMAVKASPVTDLVNTVAKNPKARHFVNDIALQGAGEAVGTAILPGVGTTVGAGVGNAVAKVVNDVEDDPDLAKRAMQYIFADPQHSKLINDLMTENPDKAAQYVQSLGIPLLQRFTQGAIFQLIGLGIGTMFEKTIGSLKGSALDVGSKILPGASETLEQAGGMGVKLNPDMITSSKVADVLDKTARRGVLSGDKMRAFDLANKEAIAHTQKQITTELAGGLSEHIPRTELADYITSTNEVGQKVQKAVSDHLYSKADEALGGSLVPVPETAPSGIIDPSTGKEIMTKTGNTIYKRMGGIMVPTTQIKDLAQLELTKSELINGIGNAEKLGGLLGKIKNLDAGVNFSDMKNLRSEILDLNRDATTNGAKRILSSFASKINEVMQDTAGDLNPEGFAAWKKANEFYKEGVTTFQDDTVAKIITNDHRMADNLGNAIYRNGNIQQIEQLKRIAARVNDLVNNPKYAAELQEIMEANPRLQGILNKGELTYDAIINRYKRGYLQEMFDAYTPKNVNPRNGAAVPNFQGLVGELQHPEAMDTMKQLFKPEEITKLKDFAKVGALAMKHASEALTERIGMLSRMTGWATGPLAAKLLTDPESQPLLMNGIRKFAENTPKAIKAGTELLMRSVNAILDRNTENQ